MMRPVTGKTLDVLTRSEVIEQYNLTPHFLRYHGRAMGGQGKPMRFDRDLVEAYLRQYFRAPYEEALAEMQTRALSTARISLTFANSSDDKVRPIMGRKATRL